MQETDDKSRKEKLIAEAKARFELCVEAESEQREKSLNDLEFMADEGAGRQWPERSLRDRAMSGRPALVVNRIDQFVQHITNSMRQNRVSARVFPVDDSADPETGKIIQGLLRNIEYQSSADIAYDTAAFYAVASGFGYYRLLAEYAGAKSFEQDLRIRRIKNPFQVYLDPNCTDPAGSDSEFGFIIADLSIDEFKQQHPNAELSSADDFTGYGDQPQGWLSDSSIRVVEYYYKTYQHDTLYRLDADGVVMDVLKSELPEGKLPEGITPVAERETQIPQCRYAKFNAVEVLEEKDWPIPQVPIIRIIGAELDVNGKTTLKGIIRNLKDAQRQYNFMLTAQTEAAMDQGTVVAYEGQMEGYEEEWATRLRRNPSVLPVKATTVAGQAAPMPTRLMPDPSIQAKTEARLMAADDLKALTGIYDSALGARSNETSGKAILSRQQQSETANFHFEDNKTRAITVSTKMLVDLIPTYYDTKRTLRIIGEDDTHKLVKVNQPVEENGEQRIYDLTTGKYDVVCTSGPSFATKRQEGAQMLTQLAQAAPIIMNAAPDLVMKIMDIPYADEIAERLKRTLPPNLVQDEDGQKQIPPEVQQAMAQSQQQVEMLTQQLQELQRTLETKQIESQTKIETTRLQEESKAQIETARLSLETAKLEFERWKVMHGSAHEMAKQNDQQQFDAEIQRRNDIAAQQTAQLQEEGTGEEETSAHEA